MARRKLNGETNWSAQLWQDLLKKCEYMASEIGCYKCVASNPMSVGKHKHVRCCIISYEWEKGQFTILTCRGTRLCATCVQPRHQDTTETSCPWRAGDSVIWLASVDRAQAAEWTEFTRHEMFSRCYHTCISCFSLAMCWPRSASGESLVADTS